MTERPRGPFRFGDRVQLTGPKGRLHTITLREKGELHTHHGVLKHEQLVGQPDGSVVANSSGHEYLALRPLLRDFVMSMPRGAAIVYPKDAAQIIAEADVFPGAVVVEAGVGSGALSTTLLRAGAVVHGYEIREEFANRAQKNVRDFLGEEHAARYTVELRDCYEGIDETDLDRVVLDLPEPWQVVPHAAKALHAGGILVAYTPSIIQASQVRDALSGPGWISQRTLEVLHRTWHVEGAAVRPDHRMVAHTGFLTVARSVHTPPA